MASCDIQTILRLATLILLLIYGDAQEQDPPCIAVLKVKRNTVRRASATEQLRINCTVEHCTRKPHLTWCKLGSNISTNCNPVNNAGHIKIQWEKISENEGISHLLFLNISMDDAGLYRCGLSENGKEFVSHTINVTVAEKIMDFDVVSNENKTANTLHDQAEDQVWLWPYIYISCGIAGLVIIILIISLLVIRGCPGSNRARKEKISDVQYMATPMTDVPPPVPVSHGQPRNHTHSLPARPTAVSPCIYDNAPARRTSHNNRPSSSGAPPSTRGSANQVAAGGSSSHGNRRAVEEESLLVYASLNHQARPRGPARPSASPQEECSEYAAIRVS